MSTHRDTARRFDAAMAAGARLHGLALVAALDWSTTRRVCDVGGGDGSLLVTLLDSVPHLQGVLLDLPDVVAATSASARMEVVGGDAFVAVPPDCDVYLLVNVLHDWDDERAADLLTRMATSTPLGAMVIVVEGQRRRRPVDGIPARTDVLMLALAPGGRERTRDDFAELARRSGHRLDWVIPLPSADAAFVLTRI